jgi:hypothetical protein
LDADERAELERLRKENAELRLDVAFLNYQARLIIQKVDSKRTLGLVGAEKTVAVTSVPAGHSHAKSGWRDLNPRPLLG